MDRLQNGSLPPLRVILKPNFGFGFDVAVRLGRMCNAFMSAEAFVTGKSHVQFGIQPRFAPWVRLHIAPFCQLSLRIPIMQVSGTKTVYVGGTATFADEGRLSPIATSSRTALWKSLCGILLPSFEIHHSPSILSILLNDRKVRALREYLREKRSAREQEAELREERRQRLLRTFDERKLPPLEPRRERRPVGPRPSRNVPKFEDNSGTSDAVEPGSPEPRSNEKEEEGEERIPPGFIHANYFAPSKLLLGESRRFGY